MTTLTASPRKFEVDVVEHNLPPEVTSTPTTNIRVNEYWSYLVQATDPNGDTLTYSLDQDSLTRGMTINATTGRILWTPDTVGSYPVVVTVDDGHGLTATHSFTIAVNNANPEINSQPTGPAYVGTQWSYQVIATDADGHALQYELLSPGVLPDDMQIDANGLLTWTPTTTDAVDIEIKVSDSAGGYRTQSFTLEVETVVPPNQAPVIDSIPVTSVELNQVYQYQIDAYDPNGDDLIYSLNSAPAGMSIDDDGLISWSPQTLGEYSVELVVEDPAGLQSTQTFTLIVTAPVVLNEGPEITSQPTGPAVKDRAYQYRAIASDPNGDTIIWSLDPASVVGDMAINATTGQLTWTPADDGTYSITVIATDSHGAAASQTFSLVVLKNAAPVITSTPSQSVDIDVAYSYQVLASDPNPGDTISYALTDSPAGATIDAETGLLSWTSSTPGLYSLTITATDQDGATSSQTYQLQVIDPVNNNAPVLTSAPRSQVQVDQRFLYQVEAFDSDGDTLSYSLVSGPAGMVLDSKGLLDWTPTGSDVAGSPHTFTILVEDGRGGSVQESYEINVVSEFINTAPQFTTSPSTNLVVGKTYTYDANGVDADGDTIRFRLVTAPDGMTINAETGFIQWTPSINDLGEHTMTVRLLDTYGAGIEQTVTLTVRSVNLPPMITSRPPTQIVINDSYDHTILANDPDGNTLTYSLGAQTTAIGISINSATGEIDWTPATEGTYRIHVNVFDEYGLGVAQLFDVEVLGTPPNFAPYITTRPAVEAEAGAVYTYDVDALDPNLSDTITYSLVAPDPLLTNMTFDTNTGLITWTPDVALVGQLVQFKVVATDGSLTSTQSYSVRVQPANVLPDVGAIDDLTLSAGAYFNYGVYAWDANADTLTYSLDQASLDRGMTIDSTYGLINWQTDIDDISATPYDVVVTVSDGRGTPVTEEFSITVEADQTAPAVTITLLNNSDKLGQELSIQVFATDQVGVTARTLTLYSVTLSGTTTVLNQTLAIDANGIARLTLSEDLLGTLTFTASAVDAAGNEGTATPVELQVLDPSDQSPPSVTLTSLTYYQEITAPIDILGSVTDDSLDNLTWVLSAIPHDGGATKIIASGTGALNNEVIGRFDPTLLRNGVYTIELEATDAGGNVSFDSEVIKVDGNLKLGNFTLSFVDLEVPVSGIPITVTRTYDTLDADIEGDFGYGWSLALSNTRVRIVQADGADPGLSGYPIFEDGTRIVVTLPDGTEEGFTFKPDKQVSGFVQTGDYLPMFIPDAGVTSKLVVDKRYIRKLGDGYIDMETGLGYSPANPLLGGAYTLVLRNGVEMAINAETGDLSTITDLNGNQITFTGMGIESNTGRSIQFERDYAGRISAIIDPAGNRLEYSYDADGNLVSMTDRIGATTQFTYLDGISDPEHYLDEIIDPLGRSAVKTVYDEDGRLIKTVDETGQSIEFDWDINSGVQKITDKLGNVKTIITDSRGNVIREENSVGDITLWTYDGEDRLLSRINVVGEIDSVENGESDDIEIVNKYDANGDLVILTDKRGNATHVTYTSDGRATNILDKEGNANSYIYNNQGLPVIVQDAFNVVGQFTYDSMGNITGTTTADGVLALSSTYNQYGDLISTSPARGYEAYFEYDINGYRTSSWYYDESDEGTVKILNSYEYDENRRLIKATTKNILNPDTAEEVITDLFSRAIEYDLLGNIVSESNEQGLISEKLFDLLGREIESRRQSINEDGDLVWVIKQTVYNANGQPVIVTDEYSSDSDLPITGVQVFYDAAGREIKTESLRGIHITISGGQFNSIATFSGADEVVETYLTAYDEMGRVKKTTDRHGNETHLTYSKNDDLIETRTQSVDESGNQVWIVYRTIYDDYGRIVLTTDAYIEGATDIIYGTRELFDSKGRSVGSQRLQGVIIDIVDNETVLISAGTILSEGEVVYDNLGLEIENTSSDGMSQTYEYDELNRQVAIVSHPVDPSTVGIISPEGAALVSIRSEKEYDSKGKVSIERTNIYQFDDGTIDYSNMESLTYEYNEYDQLKKATLSDGTFFAYSYDHLGRKISETNQLGQTRIFEYDQAGRLMAINLPAVQNPDDNNVLKSPRYEYAYDALGNQTLIRDPLGHETRFTYDEQGRQISRTLPLGYGTDGIYGTADDLSLPEGDLTESYSYDTYGRVVVHVSFEGTITRFIYDDRLNGSDRILEKQFFNDQASYQDGTGTPDEIFTYVYDAFGREVSVTQQSASESRTTTTTYDSNGQVVQVASPEGIVNYEYDQYGRKIRTYTGDPSDPVTDTLYTYDSLGRLETVSVIERNDEVLSTPETTIYEYDLAGNLDQTILFNGVITDYAYDDLNRLETLTHYLADETPDDLSDNDKIVFEYELQADGKRTKETETIYRDENENGQFEASEIKTVTTDWTYDEAGRLTDEVFRHYDDLLDQSSHFTYDLTGNRLEQQVEKDFDGDGDIDKKTTTYSYDANDRLLSETTELDDNNDGSVESTSATTYSYTGTQQTGKTVSVGGVNQSTTAFTYDLQGRMETVTITTLDGTGTATRIEKTTYDYDATGIRVSSLFEVDADADGTVDETTKTEYLNDPSNFTGYSQVIQETEYDENGVITKHVVYTIGHDQISQTTIEYVASVPQTPQTLFFLTDGHGSTRVLADVAGAISNIAGVEQLFFYDAYGNLLNMQASESATSYLYSGEQFDAKIGQQYLRARYYDANTGRFNRLDPFFGNMSDPQSFHKYLYSHADPANNIDPSGLHTLGNVMAGIGVSSTIGALSVSVINAVFKGSLSAVLPDASFFGASAGGSIGFNITNRAGFFLSKFYNPAILSTLGVNVLKSVFVRAALLELGKVQLVSADYFGVALVVGYELVTTATDLKQANYSYIGPAYGAFSNGIFASLSTGIIWGLKDILDYQGPFVSMGVSVGAGLFGGGVSVFWSPTDLSTNGISTNFNIQFPRGAGFGYAVANLQYYPPTLTNNQGFHDIYPYLALNFWPPGYNAMLVAKALYNAEKTGNF